MHWAVFVLLIANTFLICCRLVWEMPSKMPGGPDGAQVDAAGYVWVTLTGASQVVRISPFGEMDMICELPVKSPTSVTIGGPSLDTLFITTRGPDGGSLYMAKLPHYVRGLPEPEVADSPFSQRAASAVRSMPSSSTLVLCGRTITNEQEVRTALMECGHVDPDMKVFLNSTQGQRLDLSPR